jgi:hypothetical protein
MLACYLARANILKERLARQVRSRRGSRVALLLPSLLDLIFRFWFLRWRMARRWGWYSEADR